MTLTFNFKLASLLSILALLSAVLYSSYPIDFSSFTKDVKFLIPRDIIPTNSNNADTASNHIQNVVEPKTQHLIPKLVSKSRPAIEQAEGDGARVRRSIGTMSVRNFTPFLMLDHFMVSPEAGFPDHPHRGQETITYMMKGNIDHEDFTGSAGTLGPGDLQFMTAGRGIMHAEMPRINKSEDSDIQHVEGLQLWVDLPVELKECEPRYRDLRSDEIPLATPDPNVQINVISGESHGVISVQDLAYTPVWLLDITIQPGGNISQHVPKGFNTFLYIMEGEIQINNKTFPQHEAVFFEKEGNSVQVNVPETFEKQTRFVLVSGKILDQPIVQHGPFVETSRERIMKAFMDYQSGTNGFERAVGWESKIGKRSNH